MHFLLVDDHPLYREALRGTVLHTYPETIIEEAGHCSKLGVLSRTQIVVETASLNCDRPA